MKGISYSLIRVVFALIVGLVIVLWPNTAINYLIITLGVLFLIPGLISLVSYGMNKKKRPMPFPIEGIGSTLFGLVLVIIPQFFANILTVILGLAIMLGGLQQVYALVRARRWKNVPFFLYIIPTLIFFAGLYVVVNPSDARATALMIIGVTAIVYAIFELVNWMLYEKDSSSDEKAIYIDTENKNDN